MESSLFLNSSLPYTLCSLCAPLLLSMLRPLRIIIMVGAYKKTDVYN
jgi:hypothetical protein